MTESEIRDYLTSHLELVEPGLVLIDKEYRLPNPGGAHGRIDILARDRFGTFVVIELKKSNSTARAALHELFKYLALLQSQKGIPIERLRCVLVSTDWHELLVPFSEAVHTSPFSLQGRLLQLDDSGCPIRSEPIEPLRQSQGLCFPNEFSWLTFSTLEARERVALQLDTILSGVGLTDGLYLKFTSLRPQEVMYPYSIILPFFPFSREEALAILAQQVFPVLLLEDFEIADTKNADLETLREAVQSFLESEIFCIEGIRDVHCSISENLEAEKEDWQLDAVFRFGPKVGDKTLLSDQDILSALCGSGGANDIQLVRAVDPSHKLQFSEFCATLERFLSRYGWWTEVDSWLKLLPNEKNATIVAHAYCPNNFLKHLALFLRTSDVSWLPSFDLFLVTPKVSARLWGTLAWDGVTSPPPLDQVIADNGPGGNVLRLAMSDPEDALRLIRALGFVFPITCHVDGDEPVASSRSTGIVEWLEQHLQSAEHLSHRLGPIVA